MRKGWTKKEKESVYADSFCNSMRNGGGRGETKDDIVARQAHNR